MASSRILGDPVASTTILEIWVSHALPSFCSRSHTQSRMGFLPWSFGTEPPGLNGRVQRIPVTLLRTNMLEYFLNLTSPAPSFLASSILMPWGAATTTLQPPFCRSIWARLFGFSNEIWTIFFIDTHTNPVGPAPNMRTDEPILGEILSRPCAAQEAGSSYFVSEWSQFLSYAA